MEDGKGIEQDRQRRRQVGDDRAARIVMAELDAPARAGHLGQDLIILPIERARHAVAASSLCLFFSPLYEDASRQGEALISALLTSLATAIAEPTGPLGLSPIALPL